MKQCLVWLFLCLSKCGCRNRLLRAFAFFPPKPPTYILVAKDKAQKYEALTEVAEQEEKKSNNSLKIYRVSRGVTLKDVRPYNADLPFKLEQLGSFDSSDPMTNEMIIEQSNKSDSFEFQLLSPGGKAIEVKDLGGLEVKSYYTGTRANNRIALIHVQPATPSRYVIIYSHPNSADLGLMFDNFLDLAYNLKVNVLAYDYAGYGQSTGRPSDLNAIVDLEAVYLFAVNELRFSWNNIILYGQSIGSGPSVILAANSKFPVAGLVIHSGLASGLRVFNPGMKKTPYNDLFPNEVYLRFVNCLVYIFHGSKDHQISVSSAEALSRSVRNLHCVWFIENAGHNNIEFESKIYGVPGSFRLQYFQKLRSFVREVQSRNKFYRPEELLKLYRAHKWSEVNHIYKDYLMNLESETMSRSSKAQSKSSKEHSGRPPTMNSFSETSDIELPAILVYMQIRERSFFRNCQESPSQGKKRRMTELSVDPMQVSAIKEAVRQSPRKSVQVKNNFPT